MLKNLREIRQALSKMTKSGSDYSLAKVADQVYLCITGGDPVFTEFLDPVRRQFIHTSLKQIEELGMTVVEEGGYPGAERKMMGFAMGEMNAGDFPISGIFLEYDNRYGTPSHGDILGSVLGLGLDRSIVGDILMLTQGAVILVDSRMESFLVDNLFKVGRISVSARLLPVDSEFFVLDNRVPDRIICASLRLDSVLAVAFNLSRGEATSLVKTGKAYLNWQEENSPSRLVKPGDMVTLRRFGRIQIVDFAGKSKKDRFIIEIVRF